MKRTKLPMCATMRIGPRGDLNGVSVEECAIRMAKAGAQVVGRALGYSWDIIQCLSFDLSFSIHHFLTKCICRYVCSV